MSKLEEWMQKLMWYVEEMRGEWINVCRPQFQQFDLLEMMLISKQYPLVKRLVDNDKIEQPHSCAINYDDEFDKWTVMPDEESLLMLLAISDTPIEDLISYLK